MHIGWAFKCQLFHPSVERPPRNTLHEIQNVKRWLLAPSPCKSFAFTFQSLCLDSIVLFQGQKSDGKYQRTLHMISCMYWKRSSLRHCWLTFRQIWTQTLKTVCNKLDAMHCKFYVASWTFVSRIFENLSVTFIEEHVWENARLLRIWTNLTLLNIIQGILWVTPILTLALILDVSWRKSNL